MHVHICIKYQNKTFLDSDTVASISSTMFQNLQCVICQFVSVCHFVNCVVARRGSCWSVEVLLHRSSVCVAWRLSASDTRFWLAVQICMLAPLPPGSAPLWYSFPPASCDDWQLGSQGSLVVARLPMNEKPSPGPSESFLYYTRLSRKSICCWRVVLESSCGLHVVSCV